VSAVQDTFIISDGNILWRKYYWLFINISLLALVVIL